MRSAFDPEAGTWEVGWPGRVSKHDVVYLTPPGDPMQGMPIGNGDVGVLCWCEGGKIIMAVNKCDLWDEAPFGRFHNWKPEEEDLSTTLRHAGRIVLDFGPPVFDLFYLSDFEGRISLADASLHMRVAGQFGTIGLQAFVSHDSGILCCQVESDLLEIVPVEILIERYGSRSFSHWYSLVNRDAAIGLGGTSSSADDEGAFVSHKLTGGSFAVGLSVIPEDGSTASYSREHSHTAKARVVGGAGKRFSFIATVTSPVPEDPVETLKEELAEARREGPSGLLPAHSRAWKAFWMRSFMEYGDDYLDNLWHLTMYYANSSQRGSYPGRFINGLWGWNRDVQNWNFYFHWNQQQVYWPLNAAGHHDLVESYLDYRFRSLPHARQDAREVLKASGAFVSDVCDARGRNSLGELANHTPVAQIAMEFWRQYCFTGDEASLRNRALPYMLEAARFFESLFERGIDGKYHAREGTGYEGWIKLRDCISELVYGQVLFTTAMKALDIAGVSEPRVSKWKEIVDNLAPLPTGTPGNGCLFEENGRLRYGRGFFKGQHAFCDDVLAAGWGIEEERILHSKVSNDQKDGFSENADPAGTLQMLETSETPKSFIAEDMKVHDGIFPFVEYSAVFPSGLVGLSQKGSRLFDTAANTAKLYSPDVMGWDPLPIVLARVGLSEELAEILKRWPGRWQFYPNGFGHYGPRDIMKAESALRFRTYRVRDACAAKKEHEGHGLPEAEGAHRDFVFPTWSFRHMGMESMSVLSCAMNESLLTSYDGVIRVAPAAPHAHRADGANKACQTNQANGVNQAHRANQANQANEVNRANSARFTLHATGGFVVSAEIKDGKPLWVSMASRLGETCMVVNPWEEANLYRNGKHEASLTGERLKLTTQPGDRLTLVPYRHDMENWQTEQVSYEANATPKTSWDGRAVLGLPRMF